jgi:hypothetical protein
VSPISEENKRTTRRVLEELFEEGNLDAADELVHPDFVNHEAPPDNPQDPRACGRRSAGCVSKLIEHWSVRDDLGQALQLGLLD